MEPVDLHESSKRIWTGKGHRVHTYRYANAIPLYEGGYAITVNWAELTIENDNNNTLKIKDII